MFRSSVLFFLLLSLLAVDVSAADSGARERAFVRSLELFDAAKSPSDYRESAKELESIVADGFRSGAVFYNLGNAYYRAGEYGRAIINYRKAKPYRPRDVYLSANLQQALAAAPGRLSEAPRPWWTHVLFWTEWFSYPTKVRLACLGGMLAAITTAVAVLLRRPKLHLGTLALLLVAAALSLDAGLSSSTGVESSRAVITGETVARKGTGNSYEPAFDQPLRDGAEFQILNETNDWTFGHFEGIGDGWVRNEFVAK
jgi:tetratricopeptide (TPR) repeat protein